MSLHDEQVYLNLQRLGFVGHVQSFDAFVDLGESHKGRGDCVFYVDLSEEYHEELPEKNLVL
jgi:hypothetical protein